MEVPTAPQSGPSALGAHEPGDKIELLSVGLLDQNRALVESLKGFAHSVRLELGWHYLLDLSWILSHIGALPSKRIMDAGAGIGVLQWYLASQGAEVISVDRISREALSLRFRNRFRVQGLRAKDLLPPSQVLKKRFDQKAKGPFYRRWLIKAGSPLREALGWMHPPQGSGCVWIYNQDLAELGDIQDDSLDAVVSVSALEHNSQDGLAQVVKEIIRVLKPGGILLATLTAGRDQDWWHEASRGWCYSAASLQRLFNLAPDAPTNYERYDELLEDLRNCAELRDNLASFYSNTDQGGMPQGIWDPQYQPVGVCKIKTEQE
jgi:2-polyprenyl-3-methyl-5-hydroxy-6-metoxy-1,4-benzoquinol methylase